MRDKLSISGLSLLILPFVLVLVAICSVNPSPDFKYYYLKDNCNSQSQWIYKRIYSDETPVDVAFFGSSHTLQAINDSLIPGAINFGYCRFGRDIQYALFKDLLERKKIKAAFFEITETEPSYSHPDYPFIGPGNDIFLPSFIYNQSSLANRYDAFLFRLAYIRNCLFRNENNVIFAQKKFGYIGQEGVADATFLESEKKAKLESLKDYDPSSLSRKAELSFSTHYLSKIKKLAEENNCSVYFLYLPAYGNEAKNSLDSAYYTAHFKTIVPPDTILNDPSNWLEEAHLNNEGAKKIAKWLLDTKVILN